MGQHWTATSIESHLRTVASSGEPSGTAFIVGGGAMVVHGFRERAPDLDIVVHPVDHFPSIYRGFTAAGFTLSVEITDESDPTFMRMSHEDTFRKIELLTDGVNLDHRLTDGVRDRSESFITGQSVDFRVISREDLIVSKLLTERRKDLSDFRSIRQTDLDFAVIRSELDTQCELQGRDVPSTLFLGGFGK